MATIAEVLHYAADHFLSRPGCVYSCCAVIEAAVSYDVDHAVVLDGLRNMGVCTYSGNEFSDVKDPQGARYMWLKFAALMAEEQGV